MNTSTIRRLAKESVNFGGADPDTAIRKLSEAIVKIADVIDDLNSRVAKISEADRKGRQN